MRPAWIHAGLIGDDALVVCRRINYRTTKQARDWAVARLDGVAVDDLNDGKDTPQGYRSLRRGAAPVVRHFRTEAQESEFVVQQASIVVCGRDAGQG